MKPGRTLSRKAYRMTLGATWLIGLIVIASVLVIFPALFREGMELKESNAILIPLSPFYMAAVVLLLVWAFLRLAVPVQPLTEEERARPLLQRVSYLQLFACSGITIAAVSTVGDLLILPSLPETTLLTGWNTVFIFTFHCAAAALAAILLYTAARIGRIAATLTGVLLFIAVVFAHLPVTLALLKHITGTATEEVACSGETEDAQAVEEVPYTETDTEEDTDWMIAAATSVLHYCLEYGKNTTTDSTLCFADQLLIDFQNMQLEKPEEDYAAENSPRWNKTTSLNVRDYHYLYCLSALILGQTDLSEDEMYETVSERILPVILKGLHNDGLYPSSQLESLVNMLDYAYYDLQSPEDDKLASLYADMTSGQFLPAMAVLLPCFNRPYAMVHSGFDEVHMLWAYSFWARRWKDGHTDVCRRLLDKVLETWPNTAYTADRMEKAEQYYREKRLKSNRTPEDILREVEEAFADAPRPAQQTILINEMESEEQAKRGEIFSRYTWQEIPAEVLYANQDALPNFTPEGFRYYLPAFLTETVRNYQPGHRLYAPLLYALDYNNLMPELREEYFAILTTRQEKAVCHFLEWLGANHHADFTGADGQSPLWQAVESWWLQFGEEDACPDLAKQTAHSGSLPAGSRWAGQYELSFSLGRINDSTEVFAEYFLSIGRNSVSFIANGYKIYWDYLCTAREQDGRLIILCDRLTDGFGNLTAGDTLAIVTFDAGRYYLESPVVYDNPNATDISRHLLTKTTRLGQEDTNTPSPRVIKKSY